MTASPLDTTSGTLTRVCANDASHIETITLPILAEDSGYTYSIFKEATCSEVGSANYGFYKNGQTFMFNGPIPLTDHKTTEVRDAKSATCTEEGYSGDTYCKDCGALIKKGKVIEEIPHNFADGKCTVCGKSDGSINNDDITATVSTSTDDKGNITYNDELLSLARKYAEKIVDYIDIDTDGTVTVPMGVINNIFGSELNLGKDFYNNEYLPAIKYYSVSSDPDFFRNFATLNSHTELNGENAGLEKELINSVEVYLKSLYEDEFRLVRNKRSVPGYSFYTEMKESVYKMVEEAVKAQR